MSQWNNVDEGIGCVLIATAIVILIAGLRFAFTHQF